MKTYYVSNRAENADAGWGVAGNDSHDGMSRSTPFATIAKATLIAEEGDAVVINPTTMPYSENSLDNSYLQFGAASLVTGDPVLAGANAGPIHVPIIQAFAGSCVIDSKGMPYQQVLACVTLDGQSEDGRVGFSAHSSPAGFIFQQVNFRNFTATLIPSWRAGSGMLTLDRVTVDASCTTRSLFNFGGLKDIAVYGGIYSPTALDNKVVFYFSGVTLNSVRFDADINGVGTLFNGAGGTYLPACATRIVKGGAKYRVGDQLSLSGGRALQSCQVGVTAVDADGTIVAVRVTNGGAYIELPSMPNRVEGGSGSGAVITLYTAASGVIFAGNQSTIGSLSVEGATFVGIPQAIRMDAIFDSWKISGCKFADISGVDTIVGTGFTCTRGELSNNSFASRATHVNLVAPDYGNGCISRNNNFHCLAGSQRRAAVFWILGKTFTSTDDSMIIEKGAQTNGFISNDGVTVEASHLQLERSASLNCGDDPARKYIATAWTTKSVYSNARATHLAQVAIEMLKVGDGQDVTCSVHGDEGGVPGVLLGTSDVLHASILDTSMQFVMFTFPTPVAIAPDAKHHLVFTAAHIDGDNYVQMSLCGNIQPAGNGIVEHVRHSGDGSTWAADSLRSFEITLYSGFYGHTPSYVGTSIVYDDPNHPHETEAINAGPCLNPSILRGRFINAGFIIIKNGIGGTIAGNFMVNATNKFALAGYYVKASRDVKIVNNTVIVRSGHGITLGGDTLPVLNHVKTVNAVVRNNILIVPAEPAWEWSTPYFVDGKNVAGLAIDNNCVFQAAGSVIDIGCRADQAVWQGMGYDRNSLFADPLLSNATASAFEVADVTPTLNSPVIGRGADLRSVAPVDIVGTPFTSKPSMGCVEFMTGELLAMAAEASTLYAVVLRSDGLVWNGAGLERYDPVRLSSYAVGMAQQGESGVWSGSMPVVDGARPPPGRYLINYRVQAGGRPVESDTMVRRGKFTIEWDGVAEVVNLGVLPSL